MNDLALLIRSETEKRTRKEMIDVLVYINIHTFDDVLDDDKRNELKNKYGVKKAKIYSDRIEETLKNNTAANVGTDVLTEICESVARKNVAFYLKLYEKIVHKHGFDDKTPEQIIVSGDELRNKILDENGISVACLYLHVMKKFTESLKNDAETSQYADLLNTCKRAYRLERNPGLKLRPKNKISAGDMARIVAKITQNYDIHQEEMMKLRTPALFYVPGTDLTDSARVTELTKTLINTKKNQPLPQKTRKAYMSVFLNFDKQFVEWFDEHYVKRDHDLLLLMSWGSIIRWLMDTGENDVIKDIVRYMRTDTVTDVLQTKLVQEVYHGIDRNFVNRIVGCYSSRIQTNAGELDLDVLDNPLSDTINQYFDWCREKFPKHAYLCTLRDVVLVFLQHVKKHGTKKAKQRALNNTGGNYLHSAKRFEAAVIKYLPLATGVNRIAYQDAFKKYNAWVRDQSWIPVATHKTWFGVDYTQGTKPQRKNRIDKVLKYKGNSLQGVEYVPFDFDVMQKNVAVIYDHFKSKQNHDINSINRMLMLLLYTHLAPRRSMDYTSMIIKLWNGNNEVTNRQEEPKSYRTTEKHADIHSYYFHGTGPKKGTHTFVFNHFKSRNNLRSQVLDIPNHINVRNEVDKHTKTVKDFLDKYAERLKGENPDGFLLPIQTDEEFQKMSQSIASDYGIPFNVNASRHFYATKVCSNINLSELSIYAMRMGTRTEMVTDYYADPPNPPKSSHRYPKKSGIKTKIKKASGEDTIDIEEDSDSDEEEKKQDQDDSDIAEEDPEDNYKGRKDSNWLLIE